jgi:hypothetical protein
MLLHIRWQFIKGMINGGTLFGAKLLNYIVYVFGDALLMLIYISLSKPFRLAVPSS